MGNGGRQREGRGDQSKWQESIKWYPYSEMRTGAQRRGWEEVVKEKGSGY